MKKRIIIGLIIIAVVGLVVWGIIVSGKKAPVPTLKATRGDISRDVLVTGTTRPVDSVDLSFERTGKVGAVYVNVGDKVKAGQTLVDLEKGDILAQLKQADAAVSSAKAQLEYLKNGARPEEIAVQNVRIANARVALSQAQKTLVDSLNDCYAKAVDATRNKTDEIFTNPQSNDPILNFSSSNAQYNIDLVNKKVSVEQMLVAWGDSLNRLTADSDLFSASADAKKNLEQATSFIDELVMALNTAIPISAASQTSISAYKVNAAAARSELGLATTAVGASETALHSAVSGLTLEENNLKVMQAGSTADQLAVQQAAVEQMIAAADGVRVLLGKTSLRSPINGVITLQNAKLGQIVSASGTQPLVSIISMSKLEIDANIPEVDIGRLAIGQPVKITFDALPNEVFVGTVMKIDPAETIIDGVVNYKIKTAIDSADMRIKSGLTANLSIQTSIKKDVVLLPQNAILQNDQGTFVRVPDGNDTKDVAVKLGIRGNDGMVEIVSGVNEGDTVQDIGLKTK